MRLQCLVSSTNNLGYVFLWVRLSGGMGYNLVVESSKVYRSLSFALDSLILLQFSVFNPTMNIIVYEILLVVVE